MNKAEARRLVCGVIATTIAHDRDDIGAGWIYETEQGEDRPEADVNRIIAACFAIQEEMQLRATRPLSVRPTSKPRVNNPRGRGCTGHTKWEGPRPPWTREQFELRHVIACNPN